MMGSADCTVGGSAWTLHDASVQRCLLDFDFQYPSLEPEGSVRSIVHFEDIRYSSAPGVVYAPVDLDGRIGDVIKFSFDVQELMHLCMHLAKCLGDE